VSKNKAATGINLENDDSHKKEKSPVSEDEGLS